MLIHDDRGRVAPMHCCIGPPQNRACHSSRHTAQASHDAVVPVAPYAVLVHLLDGVLGSVHRKRRLTFPRFRRRSALVVTTHPPHVSPLSRPGTRPGIRPVIRGPSGWRTGTTAPAFPLSFDHRHWLVGRPVPATEPSSPHGRPAGAAQRAAPDLDGVSTFPTHELRPGPK
jgi:hypothetical protein